VSTSTDLRSVTFGGSPVLADGWAQPYASESGGTFHMVARRLDTNSWHHVRGTSPTDFDFAGATPLGLARHAGGPGAWDELRYTSHGLSGDPQVVGAVAVGDTLFVLYVAGVPPHGSFAGNARARGSLGVFAVVIAP
jgi:hypothetical protein